METWGRRCHKLLFMIGSKTAQTTNLTSNGHSQLVHLVSNAFFRTKHSSNTHQLMTENYKHLWQKTKLAFRYIHDTYGKSLDYDWILKVDDDAYVIVENLQLFLVFAVSECIYRQRSL